MLRQMLIIKVFEGAGRSRRDCGNREAVLIGFLLGVDVMPQSPRLRQS